MLTDTEWQSWEKLRRTIRHVRGTREYEQAMLEKFNDLAGDTETNLNAIWDHRVLAQGPPCVRCGKPLRTKQAAYCAACGASVNDNEIPRN